MGKPNFKREFSAGCVVYKKSKVKSPRPRQGEAEGGQKSKVLFLLGKHSGYHKWVLPKGLIEKEESGGQTALRETEEEMGVRAKLVEQKPIHKEQYFFYADYKEKPDKKRRVKRYKEEGGEKVKVFKTVSFYLAEYVSGDPKNHGWEMEEAGWDTFTEAIKKLAFPGEKQALQKAKEILASK